MEKWCRPIFSLSSDPRGTGAAASSNHDLAHIIKLRTQTISDNLQQASADVESQHSFENVLLGNRQINKDSFDRVVAPISNGYMFTVKPDSKAKSDAISKVLTTSVTRQKLTKKLKDLTSMSRKQNFSAMDVVINGKDKA
jgi:hypothetical protein